MVRGMKSSELFFATTASLRKLEKYLPSSLQIKLNILLINFIKTSFTFKGQEKFAKNQFDVTYHLLTISLYLSIM